MAKGRKAKLIFYREQTLKGKAKGHVDHRWKLVSPNGRIIVASSEGFSRPSKAWLNYQTMVRLIVLNQIEGSVRR